MVTVQFSAKSLDSGKLTNTVSVTAIEIAGPATGHVDMDIQNDPPNVTLNPVSSHPQGSSVPFQGSFTDLGAADGPFDYQWQWGDGTSNTTGSTSAAGALNSSHTFAGNGIYTVRLTVTDKDGGFGYQEQKIFIVPQIQMPSPLQESQQPTTFSAQVTDHGENDSYHYQWSFSDDAVGTTTLTRLLVSRTFPIEMTVTVYLTITDVKYSLAGSTSAVVQVENAVPTITTPATIQGYKDIQLRIPIAFTDPAGSADNPYTVSWDFGPDHGGIQSQSACSMVRNYPFQLHTISKANIR